MQYPAEMYVVQQLPPMVALTNYESYLILPMTLIFENLLMLYHIETLILRVLLVLVEPVWRDSFAKKQTNQLIEN